MVERRLFKNFDFGIVLLMLGIVSLGLAVIYSASRRGPDSAALVHKQFMWAIAGLIGFAIAATVDHKSYPRIARWAYVVNLLCLAAVLVIGRETNGAKSWIRFGGFAIQPSEFAKVAVVITLAVFLSKRRNEIGELRTFALSFAHVAVPLLLVMKQPDLGTALVIITIWFGMTFIAGAKPSHLLAFVGAVAVLAVVGWHSGIVKDYQKERLVSFVNPTADSQGASYQILQSRIAVGSGQFTGKGWLHGTQGQLGFIPERHTDFIFTVLSEEFGFLGAGGLVIMYLLLIWRGLMIMSQTEDAVGRLAATGFVCMFLFHVVENVGMTIGIMPVTGVPLPLFSYGGSNLLTSMVALGLLVGIGIRRHKINF